MSVVGQLADFPPGTHRVVEVDGREVGVFNVDGDLYALPNVCPHQTGPLCEARRLTGTLMADPESGWSAEWRYDGEVLTCPWHGLQYRVTSGECLHFGRIRIRRYPVTVSDGEVHVRLGRPDPPA